MHRMECEEPWFSLLRSGKKRFTGRKNSPKYQGIRVGDSLELFCGDEKFHAKVADIKKFDSIEEYFQTVTVERALPGVETLAGALKIYSKWSTTEEVDKWGFLAIFIQPQ